ncbi:MAG: hypothetical protein ACRCVV_03050 [Shewanella sp.]
MAANTSVAAISANEQSVMRTKLKIISVATASIIALISVLNMIDMPVELRFEKVEYNYVFAMALCVALPLSIFFMTCLLKERWKMYVGVGFSILLALPSFLTYYVASVDYEDIRNEGVDASFEKIDEVAVGDSVIRLYRTNGGATTSFGLVARRETKLIQGINVVEVLFSKYKASEGTMKLIDEFSIELKIQPYSENEGVEVVTLKI